MKPVVVVINKGIGSERCADVINKVNGKYNEALNKLNRIDASKL